MQWGFNGSMPLVWTINRLVHKGGHAADAIET